MTGGEIRELADRVESAAGEDAALDEQVAAALAAAFGKAAAGLAACSGLLGSTDAALHAIDQASPGWEVSIRGVASEPDGHWTCSLRETSVTDDDSVIGIGHSRRLPSALIAALLRIGAMRLPH